MSDHEPRPNERAPVKEEGQLSPPSVRKPIYECARKVFVSGFVPHATITVYANGVEVLGQEKPYVGYADIKTKRPLVPGDAITATQEAFGLTSVQSYHPVTVEHQPKVLGTPSVGPTIYDCGRIVPVSGLTPSTHVQVYQANAQPVPIIPANLIGTAECTGTSVPVATGPLKKGWYVAARQISCPGTSHELDSAASPSVLVPPEPSPVNPPDLKQPIPGSDVVNLDQLYVGAAVTVTDENTHADIGGGLATATANWARVAPNIDGTHKYHAVQALCTKSAPSPSVAPTKELRAPVLFSPICPETESLTIDETTINAVVVVYRISPPDVPGRVGPPDTVIAIGGAAPGELVLSLGPQFAGKLKIGDRLYAAEYIGGIISARSNVVTVSDCRNVVTQHNDMRRTGAYLHETTLTTSLVRGKTFGRLFERNVTGSPYAQILYVRGVRTPKGIKNLFLVATSTNDIYAFDADDHSANPATAPVWQRNLGPTRLLNNTEICPETIGTVGVTSTPVIDVAAQRIYVLGLLWPGSGNPTAPGTANLNGEHWLFALQLTDGKVLNQVKVGGTDPRTKISFDARVQRNRPGLLLLNGSVYAGFATFSCDGGAYHGWVFGYTADQLLPSGIFCTSESGDIGSGIWQSGNGLAGSDAGFIYVMTGNDMNTHHPGPGYVVPPVAKYADNFIRLRIVREWPGLIEAGHFQPSHALRLRDGDRDAQGEALKPPDPNADGSPTWTHWGDTDLGSGGPVLLPGGRLIGGGKQGRYYVMESHTMQLTQDTVSPAPAMIGEGFQAFVNTYRNVAGDQSTDFEIYGAAEGFGPNIHGGPCYWPGPSLILQMSEKDYLKSFTYDMLSGIVQQTPTRTGHVKPLYGMPGGHSSLSANGDQEGILWTTVPLGDGQGTPVPGTMYAFDALTLNQIWQDPTSEWFAKFNPPTIADGKVFRPVFAHYGNVPNWDPDQPAPTVLGPGKVVVYGQKFLKKTRRRIQQAEADTHAPRLTIEEKWRRFGGSGVLTKQVGRESKIATKPPGLRRDYSGFVGSRKRRVSLRAELPDITFHRRPTKAVPISASIFWSASTGAQIVLGEIRDEYLRQGGPEGRLGYPISDEVDTADGQGRASYFQRGDISWTATDGAVTRLYQPR